MPEVPEVTLVANHLASIMNGHGLTAVEILNADYAMKKTSGLKTLARDIESANVRSGTGSCITIESVKNKGKLGYIALNNDHFILFHLGMTGQFLDNGGAHAHISFTLDNDVTIYFHDTIRYGRIAYVSKATMDKELAKLGPDIMQEKLTDSEVLSIFRKRNRRNISLLLLDQSVFSGIGNYLRAEILYACKISPKRTVSSLSDAELLSIYKAGKRIAKAAYKAHSYDDYFNNVIRIKLNVYGKGQDSDGNPVEKFKQGGRTVWWVPAVQK